MATLSLAWRIAVVGFCFVAFGIGGIALSVVVFPLLRVCPGGIGKRERRARGVVRASFGALLSVLQASRVLRMELRNIAALRAPGAALILANHPSYLDIVVLIAHIPDAICVVKSKLWSNPFFGGVVRAAGYIRNDEPENLIRTCAERLAAGLPVIIFPEGTRSTLGRPLHFVRGAAHIALSTEAPIRPVVLRCEPQALSSRAKWYEIPARAFRISVEVLPSTSIARLLEHERRGARTLTAALERFFINHLEYHERTVA